MKRLFQYFTVNDKQSISLIPLLSDFPWEGPPKRREIFNQQEVLLPPPQKKAWNHLWIWEMVVIVPCIQNIAKCYELSLMQVQPVLTQC